MRKLLSLLLLAACLLAAPIRAYAADVVELDDTPPMEEDAGSAEQIGSPVTSEPSTENSDESPAIPATSAGNSDKAADTPASGTTTQMGGNEQLDRPATSEPSIGNSDEATEASASESDSQSSGDMHTSSLWIGLLVIALLALTAVCVFGRRKSRSAQRVKQA